MSPGVAVRRPREMVEVLRFLRSPVCQMQLRKDIVAFLVFWFGLQLQDSHLYQSGCLFVVPDSPLPVVRFGEEVY